MCPPWLLTRTGAHASFKGTSSSDSWTVGVLTYVLPYLWSRLDSVTLLMPNTPKIILSAPDKRDTKVGFQRIPFLFILLHLAAPHPIAHSFRITSLQVCHPIKSTILTVFFHQRNSSWFEEASWPQQCSLLPKTSWLLVSSGNRRAGRK